MLEESEKVMFCLCFVMRCMLKTGSVPNTSAFYETGNEQNNDVRVGKTSCLHGICDMVSARDFDSVQQATLEPIGLEEYLIWRI